jgi:hypothetical protein
MIHARELKTNSPYPVFRDGTDKKLLPPVIGSQLMSHANPLGIRISKVLHRLTDMPINTIYNSFFVLIVIFSIQDSIHGCKIKSKPIICIHAHRCEL